MPIKPKQIQFRLSWLRQRKGDKADSIARALIDHPKIKTQIEANCCPICHKPFNECEYFKQLDED